MENGIHAGRECFAAPAPFNVGEQRDVSLSGSEKEKGKKAKDERIVIVLELIL
jgi:hypothetical protein